MKQFQVSLSVVREKVFIIKFIRAFTAWGLKDCKDWCESNFTFDSFMTHRANFDVTVTAEQLGLITHYSLEPRNIGRVRIEDSKEVTPKFDVFNFTGE